MLSLEKVKNELKTFGYEYANNKGFIVDLASNCFNITKVPLLESIIKYKPNRYWDIADNLFIPWSEITSFKMKNGLLENEMILSTSAMKIEMKINKVVANNSWVKDNLNYLKAKNYFYHQ